MTNKITNSQIVEKFTRYYTLQRTAFKSLIKLGDMPYAHYQILSMLGERGQMRMGEISDIMAISRPNLTPLVDKLVALHMIERIAHVHDRRVTYIGISDAGRQALEREQKIVAEGIKKFTSKLTDEEREKFIQAMDNITQFASRM